MTIFGGSEPDPLLASGLPTPPDAHGAPELTPVAGRASRSGLTAGLVIRRSPGVVLAMLVLVCWVVIAIVGPIFFGEAALDQDLENRLLPPFDTDNGFLGFLGTDALGRSMVARLIAGSRTALLVAGLAVLISAVVGTTIGMVSGYFGRTWVDVAIMRFADMIMTVPGILLALTVLYILSPGVGSLVVVLAFTRLPVYMRLARARVLELRELAFVTVSQGLGSKSSRIIFTDLLPLVVPTIGTIAMLEMASALLFGAGLSFIGVGLQPPTVDWGLMVAEGEDYLVVAWWLSLLPGAAIMLVAFSANIVSNWLRSMADPAEMARIMASRKWATVPRTRDARPQKGDSVGEVAA